MQRHTIGNPKRIPFNLMPTLSLLRYVSLKQESTLTTEPQWHRKPEQSIMVEPGCQHQNVLLIMTAYPEAALCKYDGSERF